jgi:hypothetical protein
MELIQAFILIGIGIAATKLYNTWSNTDKRLTALERQIASLEAANRQRLPYRAMEEMLDAMAALDKEKTEMEFHVSLIDNAIGHMTNAMRTGTSKE